VSHLGRFLHRQWDCLAKCVLRLDGCPSLRHDQVLGGLGQGLLQLLVLCGCQQSISTLTALSVAVESPHDISPDGDDAPWPWYIQDQIGKMQDCHELLERWPSQESIVRSLKIDDLKLYVFHAEVFLSPKGYGKNDLADGGCYYPRDYAVERSLIGMQQGSG
jgi:hypothetical protein